MKARINLAVNYISLFLINSVVMIAAGAIWADVQNYGLFDVIQTCAIVFIGGTVFVWMSCNFVNSVWTLLPKEQKSNDAPLKVKRKFGIE